MAIEKECCCSKEPKGYVPISRVFAKVDELAAVNDRDGIERVLDYWESEARALGDDKGLLEILSEQIGFYRRDGDESRGLKACEEALDLLQCNGGAEGVPNATIYLNIATTMRAFSRTQEALEYFDIAMKEFTRLLPEDDNRLSGLYNNYATALAELGRYDEAENFYLKAADILKGKGAPEIAITYVNLAQLVYDRAGGEDCDDGVDKYLQLAEQCLDEPAMKHDGPYANVLGKVAEAFGFYGYFLKKEELAERAAQIYERNRSERQ